MPTQHTVKSYDQELNLLARRITEMGGLVETQISAAVDALVQRNTELADEVIRRDDDVDRLEEEIDQLAIRILATRQPVAVDLRLIVMALKISNDLERIGDYAVNMARRCYQLVEQPAVRPLHTIPRMAQIAQAMVKDVLDAYGERDVTKAIAVWHRDDEVDDLYTSLFRELLTYMLEDPRNISACTHLLFIAKNIERIGDHATNIAEKIHYMIHARPLKDALPRAVS
jgi:phosphate transport system protein